MTMRVSPCPQQGRDLERVLHHLVVVGYRTLSAEVFQSQKQLPVAHLRRRTVNLAQGYQPDADHIS